MGPPRTASEDLSLERPARRRRIGIEELGGVDDRLPCEPSLLEDMHMRSEMSRLEREHRVKLCDEQRNVLSLAYRGENIWITGAAGTGKSTVIRFAIQLLRSKGLRVRVVAPTGIAALNVNGTTTFVYAGWKMEDLRLGIRELITKYRYPNENSYAGKRIRSTDALIIDEISMVESNHLERLSRVMAAARMNNLPFGGVQIIVTGDFCQLPPVRPFQNCMDCGRDMWVDVPHTLYQCSDHGRKHDRDKWAFLAPCWERANMACINLLQNHRQEHPQDVELLDRVRFGKRLNGTQLNILRTCGSNLTNPTKIFSRRRDAQKENVKRLEELPGPPVTYQCIDHFKHNPVHRHLNYTGQVSEDRFSLAALSAHRYEPVLELKKGALVVLLMNLDINAGLVNGSRGQIVGFERHNYATYPRATMRDDLPSQGVDDTRERIAFEPLALVEGDHRSYQYEKEKAFIHEQAIDEWPIVQFDNGKRVIVRSHCSVQELGDDKPYSLLSRTQIPLNLGYGLTIHKSQGMTLDQVEVDLSSTWEDGQDYVAMSRTRTLDCLRVHNFDNGTSGGSIRGPVRDLYTEKFAEVGEMLEEN